MKETLKVRIKEEALRTYLIKYGAHYDSMNLSHLCEVTYPIRSASHSLSALSCLPIDTANNNALSFSQTFEIEKGSARRTVSRMIFNKEISGAWEHEPSETLVLHKVTSTSIHQQSELQNQLPRHKPLHHPHYNTLCSTPSSLQVDPSSLQIITQQVAEKVAMLVESNERMLDPLVNVYGESTHPLTLHVLIRYNQ